MGWKKNPANELLFLFVFFFKKGKHWSIQMEQIIPLITSKQDPEPIFLFSV